MRQRILAVLGALVARRRGALGLGRHRRPEARDREANDRGLERAQLGKVYDLFAEDGALQSMMMRGRASVAARSSSASARWRRTSQIELKVRHIGVIDGVVFIERVDDFVYKGHHGAVPVVGVVEVDQGRSRSGASTTIARR